MFVIWMRTAREQTEQAAAEPQTLSNHQHTATDISMQTSMIGDGLFGYQNLHLSLKNHT